MSFIDAVAAYRELKINEGIKTKAYISKLEAELKEYVAAGKELTYHAIAERIVEKLKPVIKKNSQPGVRDIVEGIHNYEGKRLIGLQGKIVYIEDDKYIGIEWDKDVGGHDCDGLAKDGYGWDVTRKCFKIISKAKPDVSRVKTKAGLERIVKKLSSNRITIGDEVVVINSSDYSSTKKGSYGVVTDIDPSDYEINFKHVTGEKISLPRKLYIEKKHVALRHKRNDSKAKDVLAKELEALEKYESDLAGLLKKSATELANRKLSREEIAEFYKSCGIDAKTFDEALK